MTSEGTPPDNERNDQDHCDGSCQQYAKRLPFLCGHCSIPLNTDKLPDQEIEDVVITANLAPRAARASRPLCQVILKESGKDVQSALLPLAIFAAIRPVCAHQAAIALLRPSRA
jgi:hypothetical protein